MLIGYARVSTDDQTLGLQHDALRGAGCERVFENTAGGAGERPPLREALDDLRAGDTLVVSRLDRLGRSLKDLIGHTVGPCRSRRHTVKEICGRMGISRSTLCAYAEGF